MAADPEITFQAIRDAQLADQTMALILELKERGEERPPWQDVSELPAALKGYWAQWNTLAVKKGVLVKRWESDDGREVRWLIVLPRGLRERVMEELHSSKTAGHLGRDKTLPKVRERYYWFGMGLDVRAFLRKCVGCAQKKGPPKKHRAPLQQYRVGAPLERVAIDVLGPLTETHQGNQYILVVGDYWTKWMEAYAMEDQQAETVAAKLVDEFVCRFGVPMELHSDQGRNFESAVFQEMCKLLGITKTRTTPYNPKSDGMVERYNRTIVNAVSLMIQPHEGQKDWDQYLPYVGFAYRSSVQASTGESPNMMMLGREVNLPVDLVLGAVPHEKELDTEYADDLRERIRTIHERARYALEMSARRQKKKLRQTGAWAHLQRGGQFAWLYDTKRKIGLVKEAVIAMGRSVLGGPSPVGRHGPHSEIGQQGENLRWSTLTALSYTRAPELVSWRYKAPRSVVEEELVEPLAVVEPQATVGSQPVADGKG